jgi:hypothetical protein
MEVRSAFAAVEEEFSEARRKYKPFNSFHEGYAVLEEEVDELWDEVKRKPSARSMDAMRAEAVQVAAMAMRILVELCEEPSPMARAAEAIREKAKSEEG